MNLLKKINPYSPGITFFILGVLFLGVNNGLMTSTFNNYLDDIFKIGARARGLLELPRELPGFVLIFITGALTVLTIRHWAVLVGLFSAVGILGLGFFSPSYSLMMIWMVIWSIADHVWIPVESRMALNLARENEEGRKLGQITGIRNLSMIIGAGIVWIMLDYFHMGYRALYLVAFVSGLMAAYMFYRIDEHRLASQETVRFVIRKKYHLFYWLNVLFGARKQLFLTFGPWLLVKNFGCRPQTIALLTLVGAALSFFFRQELGKLIDRWGERRVFFLDAGVLVVICLVYAISKQVYLLYAAFIMDNLMFAMRIARTTYLKKIADHPGEILPSLALGITMDHVVSMTIPVLG
ncbi:MAG: MFS transporter [Candidatus Delongbacteria bacterium]|nr:MFS transporter [Candidatus Delongbacteria bacterium]